jgi:hypothetical protein
MQILQEMGPFLNGKFINIIMLSIFLKKHMQQLMLILILTDISSDGASID